MEQGSRLSSVPLWLEAGMLRWINLSAFANGVAALGARLGQHSLGRIFLPRLNKNSSSRLPPA